MTMSPGTQDEQNQPERTRQLRGECSLERGELIGGSNHLLAIGINTYSSPLPPLQNCVNDVEDIARILVRNYDFADKDVRLLRNDEATRRNMIEALDGYGPGHDRSLTEKDSLILFFAGHGELRNGIGLWIPVDARGFSDYLHVSTIWDFLGTIKARHILVLADACFAGSFFASARSADPTKLAEQRPSRYVLAAGRDGPVSDGSVGENSPFAAALKRRLNTAEGAIGAVTLGEQVREDVVRFSQGAQEPRHGELTIAGNEHGQFFFHPKSGRKADPFVDIFFAHGGDLLPLDQTLRRRTQTHFQRYHEYFTEQPAEEKAYLQKLNTETYLAQWGLDIALLKSKLQILGFYPGEVNNEYTSDLANALAAFQEHHSMLHVDGYFGELTYKEIINALIMAGRASLPGRRMAGN
jgi:hypothetical protein